MDRNVRVRLSADIGDYVAKLQQAGAATKQLAQNVESSAQRNKQAWSQASTGMLSFGAAAAAGLGAVVAKSASFESQMSAVKATGSEAAANIGELRKAAMDAGAAFGQFSSIDAAKGVEQLAKAGLSAKDILGGGLTGALSLAAAGEMEVGDAAEVTAKSLAQFKLSGDQASHVADLLAAGAGKAVGDVADFGAALSQTGTVANQYGVSIEETTGVLAAFAQNALLGSDAGTSMKAMLLQLASPTAEAQGYLEKYNISAYDAQGNFVGMADLAGQLQSKLGGLSQAQQNAALKTIFGADAIRAANILMSEGAGGIQKWTNEVNDQGYAADAAAAKVDNLKGDIAALGGAFENAMISMGEGGQGPLRFLVQSTTNAVDGFNKLPAGAKSAMAAGATVAAGAAIAVGGTMKLVSSAAEARDAYKTLSAEFPKTAGAMKTFAGGAAIVTAALVAASVAGAAYQSHLDGLMSTQTEVNAAMASMANGKTSSLDAMNADIGEMKMRATDLAGAFEYLDGQSGTWDRLGVKLQSGLPDKILGMKTASAAFSDEIEKLDQSLANMAPEQAAAAFQQLSNSMSQQGVDVLQLSSHMDGYQAKLQQQATALAGQVSSFDAASLSAQDYADWMGGKVPASVQAALDAAAAGTPAQRDLAASMGEVAANAASMAEAVTQAAQAQLAASGGMIGLEAAIDAAAEAAAKNGRNLDIATEAGRANMSSLNGIAAAGLKAAEGLNASGASVAQVEGATARARGQFVQTAQSMGMTAAKANQLADSYGLIPDTVSTKVSELGSAPAKVKADALAAALKAIPASRHTEVESAFNRGGVDAAFSALNAIDGKVANTYINTIKTTIIRTVNGGAVGGVGAAIAAMGNARGGLYEFAAGGFGSAGYAPRTSQFGGRNRDIMWPMPDGGTARWNEPHLPWEAYISGDPGVRARSLAIWRQVGSKLGVEGYAAGDLVNFAAGDFRSSVRSPGVSASWGMMQAVTSPLADLAGAVRQVTQTMHQVATTSSEAVRAKQAENAAARQLAAAKGGKNGAAQVYSQTKAAFAEEDRRAKAAILAATGKRKDRLQDAKAARDIVQERELARLKAAKDRGSAASAKEVARLEAAKARATATYQAAVDKARASSDAYKAAQQELRQEQEALANAAQQASSSFAGKYGMAYDMADWLSVMREGAGDLASLRGQLEKLRAMGLSESLVQQIASAGPGQGSDMASEIIAGGKSGVAQLNAAAQSLQSAADKLGMVQAVGVKRAGGGPVWGAGTSTSDSIAARLSDGEFVMRTWAAERIGYDRLEYANRHGRMPGFNMGGRVQVMPSAPQQQTAFTFAPRVQVSGTDTREVINGLTAEINHQARVMAVQLPGA